MTDIEKNNETNDIVSELQINESREQLRERLKKKLTIKEQLEQMV